MKRKSMNSWRMKALKAWAVVDRRGNLVWDCYGQPILYKKRNPTHIEEEGEAIVRVEIKPV